jgi:hypothetical protein
MFSNACWLALSLARSSQQIPNHKYVSTIVASGIYYCKESGINNIRTAFDASLK